MSQSLAGAVRTQGQLPSWYLALGTLAGGVDSVILGFARVTLGEGSSGPEALIYLFIIPLPAFLGGAWLTYFVLKRLQVVSARLAQVMAAGLVLIMMAYAAFLMAAMTSQKQRMVAANTVEFEIFLPADKAAFQAGKRIILQEAGSATGASSQY